MSFPSSEHGVADGQQPMSSIIQLAVAVPVVVAAYPHAGFPVTHRDVLPDGTRGSLAVDMIQMAVVCHLIIVIGGRCHCFSGTLGYCIQSSNVSIWLCAIRNCHIRRERVVKRICSDKRNRICLPCHAVPSVIALFNLGEKQRVVAFIGEQSRGRGRGTQVCTCAPRNYIIQYTFIPPLGGSHLSSRYQSEFKFLAVPSYPTWGYR